MARPIDHEHHQELALRAFEAVRARGVAGLSMSAIATELGMNRSTLYWYFKSLAGIFEIVLDATIERQARFVGERMTACEHPIDQLSAWVRGVQDFYASDPDLLPVLIQMWAVGSPDDPERVLGRLRLKLFELRDDAIGALNDAIAEGLVAPCDADVVIDLCMIASDGCLVHRVSRALDPEPLLDLLITAVLEPLRLPPQSPDSPSTKEQRHVDRTSP